MVMTLAAVAAGLSAMLPVAFAWRVWKDQRGNAVIAFEATIMELIVAILAVFAVIGSRVAPTAMGAESLPLLDVDPSGWAVALFAIVAAAALRASPPRSSLDRRATAALLAAQSAMNGLAVLNDLRLMAVCLGLWCACATLAVDTGKEGDGFFRDASETAARRLATVLSLGFTLIVAGLVIALFADRAISARGGAVANHDHWSGTLSALDELPPGGSGAAIWNQLAPWCGLAVAGGLAMLCGIFPFHRPIAAAIRASSAPVRSLLCLSLLSGGWIAGWRFFPLVAPLAAEAPGLMMPLPLATQWFGAVLILSRGDIPRLTAATMLYATGQLATAIMVPAAGGVVAAGLLIPGLMPPLMAIALLLTWLETTYGSRELSEFRGLVRRLPVFSLLLIISVFWFCGLPGLSVFPGLWKAWVSREQSSFLPGFDSISLWPLLVPQVIVLWGWLRLLDALLLGPERLPQMPDALAERVELRQFGERLPEDLGRRERWTLTGLVAVGLILGVWPRLVFKPLAPAAAAPVDPQEHDGL